MNKKERSILILFGKFSAISNGGRWPLLWLTITLNGIIFELISTSVPNIKYYWYSQGPIMLFGKTLPLGIVFFCKLIGCLKYSKVGTTKNFNGEVWVGLSKFSLTL